MSLPQHARLSSPTRIALAGASVAATLATSFGQVSVAEAATATTTTTTTAATESSATPPLPTGLPSGIEALASYVPANSCDDIAKPGSIKFGDLLNASYAGTSYNIVRPCGADSLSTTEHYDGRGIDWFTGNVNSKVPATAATAKARADSVIAWLLATDAKGNVAANARRLGVMYMIWDNKIWGAYSNADGWRAYSNCAYTNASPSQDTTCHRDHIHFSLSWAGATGRTSWWTKAVAAQDYGPCRVPDLNWAPPYTGFNSQPCQSYPKVYATSGASALNRLLVGYSGMAMRQGSSGPAVSAVQQAVGAVADGGFGPATAAVVATFQRAHGLTGDGEVGVATWRALLKATAPAAAPTPPTSGGKYDAYENTVLQLSSKGTAVTVLQQALHLSPADGEFGPQTQAAVIAFQKAHQLTANGIVTAVVWRTLGTATSAPAPKPTPPVVPAPAPTGKYAAYEKIVLKEGSVNSTVKVLQQALHVSPVDGEFGPLTKSAVVAFQTAHHLTADGVVTTTVWRALGATASAPAPKPVPKPAPKPAPKPVPAPTGRYAAYEKIVLKEGSVNSTVKVLQQALHVSPVDGEFGPLTKNAVVAFEKSHHLTANGIVTTSVWRALGTYAAPAKTTAPAPAKGRYAAYEKTTLRYGSKNTTVKVLQKALGLRLVDGEFGPMTRSAVIAFQKKHHLTANGVVTTSVWRALG